MVKDNMIQPEEVSISLVRPVSGGWELVGGRLDGCFIGHSVGEFANKTAKITYRPYVQGWKFIKIEPVEGTP